MALDATHILNGEEAAVGGDNARYSIEDLLVMLDPGNEQRVIVLSDDTDVSHDAPLGFLHLDHLTEFGRLVDLAAGTPSTTRP